MQRLKMIVGSILLALGVTYVGYGLLLWSLQEMMIFPAPGGISRSALDEAAREAGAEPIDLQAADGTRLYGWYRAASGQKAVLYFHGNAETVAASMSLMRLAGQHGWDFGVVAYRGYPGSEGTPGEEGIAQDARALWQHVTEQRGIPAGRVVLHGRSLGGAVAVRLAEAVQPGGLVIESSFLSVVEVARRQASLYPVSALLRHPFDSDARAPKLDVPTVVIHGSADRVIPVHHGRALAERVAGARYVEVDGAGHNELLLLRSEAARAQWLDLLERVASD